MASVWYLIQLIINQQIVRCFEDLRYTGYGRKAQYDYRLEDVEDFLLPRCISSICDFEYKFMKTVVGAQGRMLHSRVYDPIRGIPLHVQQSSIQRPRCRCIHERAVRL